MAGDMESILFKGDDSSSGESDTEAPTSAVPQPKPAVTNSRPVTSAGLVPRTDVSTGPMSQSEMAQRLKSMYSPASKAVGGPSNAGQTGAPPQPSVSALPNVAVPATTQQIPQHRPQQQVQQQQKVPNSLPNYRPTSAGESAQQQQQQRGNIQQQIQRSGSQPQQLQQRPGGGITHQQIAPLASNVQHPSEQQTRPRMHQMQAPSIPHRPTNRLPHQQQSVRHVQQGQPQGNVPPIRNPPPSAPSQSVQQISVQRSSNYPTNVSQQQQQAQQANTIDRGVMEKKQKERFLVFTRVLMKYLETKDPPLHSKVKAIIKDCADRNRRKEAGFESVTAAMRIQLRKVVNDVYWKKAEDYLKHFLKEKASKPGTLPNASGSYTSSGSNIPVANSIGSSQEAVKRNNELQLQAQQRQPETPRDTNQDPGKGNLPLVRDDQNKKRQVGASVLAPPKTTSQAKAAPPFQPGKEKAAPKSRAKGASTPTQQRKQSLSTIATNSDILMTVPVAVPVPAPLPASAPVVREYNELMELVDHAYGFDWSVTGSVLGESTHTAMTEEQMRLLYESKKFAGIADKDFIAEGVCFPVQGWSKRNVISSRVAWSRLRAERKQNTSGPTSTNPMVAGGLLGLTQVPGKKPVTIEDGSNPEITEVDLEWYNEEKAEADIALAVLSEGTEIYLKAVVMKALHCARQRQNLDGIRLWHQQFTTDVNKPNLSLMLGCDVERQIAQSEGNAAMICRRMEEANKRQSNFPARERTLNDFTLTQAVSMSDLSLRPSLEKAEKTAELEGKRRFEIYGGKLHEEPPLGRLAKVAKLEVVDFQNGMTLSRRGRRHQAATFTSSFFF